MKIIGIDPGTAITGFGVIEIKQGNPSMLDAGVVRTPANTPITERLEEIYDGIKELCELHQPDEASVEKLFFAQNVTTAISVSHARGVVLLALAQANVKIYEYTPLQIKQAITGYGRADKNQIQEMVKLQLKLKQIPKPDDAADALAAALTHAQTSH